MPGCDPARAACGGRVPFFHSAGWRRLQAAVPRPLSSFPLCRCLCACKFYSRSAQTQQARGNLPVLLTARRAASVVERRHVGARRVAQARLELGRAHAARLQREQRRRGGAVAAGADERDGRALLVAAGGDVELQRDGVAEAGAEDCGARGGVGAEGGGASVVARRPLRSLSRPAGPRSVLPAGCKLRVWCEWLRAPKQGPGCQKNPLFGPAEPKTARRVRRPAPPSHPGARAPQARVVWAAHPRRSPY
jgi:hypothetical protein